MESFNLAILLEAHPGPAPFDRPGAGGNQQRLEVSPINRGGLRFRKDGLQCLAMPAIHKVDIAYAGRCRKPLSPADVANLVGWSLAGQRMRTRCKQQSVGWR
jgi:hypothetical protein